MFLRIVNTHKIEVIFLFNYDKLERLIKESGKTKSHLCRAMGKPVYYLRDAIGQKTAIPDELQAILAEELGVTVEYLNGLTDQKEKTPTPDGAEAIPGYEDLSEENKTKARDFIAFLLSQQ